MNTYDPNVVFFAAGMFCAAVAGAVALAYAAAYLGEIAVRLRAIEEIQERRARNAFVKIADAVFGPWSGR